MTAWSNASCRRRRSRSRPTIGESNWLTRSDAAAAASRTRQPPGAGSTVTASRRTARVAASIRISPGAASSPSRWETVSGSPVALAWAASVPPVTISPVLIPIRKLSWRARSAPSVAANSKRHVRASAAARIARSASSSCTNGSPNTAVIASPDTAAIVPPCPSAAASRAPNARPVTRRSGLWIERPAALGSDSQFSRRAPSPSFAHRGSPIRRPGARQSARRPPWDAARRSRAGRGADPA